MIGPRLSGKHSTMLAYLTTDAKFNSNIGLGRLLQIATDKSFNAVTIDDHTSTNDTCAVLASGAGGVAIPVGAIRKKFLDAPTGILQSIAHQTPPHAEGAT